MKKAGVFANGILVVSVVCFIVGAVMLKTVSDLKNVSNAIGIFSMGFLFTSMYAKEYGAPDIFRKLFVYVAIIGFIFAIAGFIYSFGMNAQGA